MGMFAVYVVDEGKEIMNQGGIPEVMTSAVSESSESALHKRKDRYYLDINASVKWKVTVEKFKLPMDKIIWAASKMRLA